MASPYLSQQAEPFLSFDGGIDRHNPRTLLDRTLYGAYSLYNAYEDAQNILLSSPTGGKHPTAMNVDSLLDTTTHWPDSAAPLIWFSPFTYSQLVGNVLTFSTHIVRSLNNGAVWRYDRGAADPNTLLRRGFSTDNLLWNHLAYGEWLVTVNGHDAPMKYGQHLFYEDQQEVRPSMIPLGAKLISPLVNNAYQTAGEVWTFSTSSGFVADNTVPGGGSRLGPESLKLTANETAATLVFTASTNGSAATFTKRDFLAPPQPFSQSPPDFAGSDSLVFQVYKNAVGSNGAITIKFGPTATFGTDNFQFDITPALFAGWTTIATLRSAATVNGTPSWDDIGTISFFNADTQEDVFIDDLYFLYATAPPAGAVAEVHQERILLGAVPDTANSLISLYWSDAKAPDNFPGANTQVMTTSSDLLAKANQINALKEFGDVVIVGMPNAILSWTIGTDGLATKATITTTIGIDSPRAIVETPTGSLLFPWQRGIYILRTTRQYASKKIAPLLLNLDLASPQWTVAVMDEKTKTARFWFRQAGNNGTGGARTSFGVVFDYVLAQEKGEEVWPSTVSQMADFAVPAYIDGTREILYSRMGGPDIYRLGASSTGSLTSYIRLPWMARQGRDRVSKWLGLTLPIASTSPVDVQIRYASNPGEFDIAQFQTVDTIPAIDTIPTPGSIVPEARVNLGRSTRWAQVQFVASQPGVEIFPPVELVGLVTQREP